MMFSKTIGWVLLSQLAHLCIVWLSTRRSDLSNLTSLKTFLENFCIGNSKYSGVVSIGSVILLVNYSKLVFGLTYLYRIQLLINATSRQNRTMGQYHFIYTK